MTTVVTRTPREVYELWIDALESGKYRQASGTLRYTKKTASSTHHTFCCLGVLCDLARKDGGPAWVPGNGLEHRSSFMNGHSGDLPDEIADYINLSSDQADHLVTLNDSEGASFKKIAKHIRKQIMPVALKGLQ